MITELAYCPKLVEFGSRNAEYIAFAISLQTFMNHYPVTQNAHCSCVSLATRNPLA